MTLSLQYYRLLQLLLVLAAAAEGRAHFATTTTTSATRRQLVVASSTWRRQSSSKPILSLFANANNENGRYQGAFIETTTTLMRSKSSSSRLAFLSHLVQHQPHPPSKFTTSPTYYTAVNPHIKMQSMQQHRTVSRLFASSSSSNNDNDNYQQQEGEEEECNLQKVYQQVQQQDSEWYTKFSNMLGDDEPTIPSCGDDASDSSTDGESVGDAVPADVAVEVDEDAASVQSVSTKENVDDIKSDEGNVEEVIAAEKVERPVT